jgi:hypothetical protein
MSARARLSGKMLLSRDDKGAEVLIGGGSHGGLALLRYLAYKTAGQLLSAWPPERRGS